MSLCLNNCSRVLSRGLWDGSLNDSPWVFKDGHGSGLFDYWFLTGEFKDRLIVGS